MKILILTSHFPPFKGGVSDYSFNLCRAFLEKGESVFVLTTSGSGKTEIPGVEIIPVISRWNLFSIPKIIGNIRKLNPDVVSFQYVPYMYGHYGVPIFLPVLIIALRVFQIPVVTTFHEVAIHFDILKPKYWIIACLQRMIGFFLAWGSQKVIVSINYYQDLLFPFKNKITKIPVGSNILPVLLDLDEKKRILKKIAPNGEKIISVFSASSAWRGLEVLLRGIFQYIQESGKPTKLVILGSQGSETLNGVPNPRELIKNCGMEEFVFISGFLPPEKVFSYLAVSDLYVSLDLTPYGGVSTKSCSLAAGYAAGLPVLGNKGLLSDEFFEDLSNIYFINKVNVEEISKGLGKLFSDKTLRERIVLGVKKSYREKLSWREIVQKYENVFRDLAPFKG